MYVDAYFDRKKDKILIAERVNGQRILKEIDPAHTFYYEHPSGGHKTIYGDSVRKYSSNNYKKFNKELGIAHSKKKRIFESDINPIFRAFADHYMGAETPNLQVAFWDIETDFDPDKGFAPADDPFNAITAISVHCNWLNELVTLALHPPTLSLDEARELVRDVPNTIVFDDEVQLLDAFLRVIEDADLISGWNSTLYDLPYIVGRLQRLAPKWLSRLCLWGQTPRARYVKKFKKDRLTFDLVGRVHLDYYELYLKHNQQVLHSYRLDYVGEIEVGENKVPYEGSLDKLYKEEFRKFIDYNRQDVALLVKIDEKKRYIELSNQVAHGNCVTLKATLGSVALVEQAIINEMHSMDVVAPDRQRTLNERDGISEDDDEETVPVVGAYVAQPDMGVHEWVGCVDINSLYPNTIIATNMSPETIIGQFDSIETDTFIAKKISEGCTPADAWEGMFHTLEYGHILNETDAILTLEYDDGRKRSMTGKEWHKYIFNPDNHVCVTANATVFRTDKDGIIPILLKKWYAERKILQHHKEYFENLIDTMIFSPEDETKLRDEYGILVSSANLKVLLGEKIKFYNSRQLAKKILLNSAYGALLNAGMRFHDPRLGKSTTLTGRSIVRHMTCKINELVTGEYVLESICCKYNDTDSEFSDTIHLTNYGPMTAEALFELCSIKWKSGEKEFSCDDRVKVLSYDPITDEPVMKQFNYVYRHHVKKKGKWKITDVLGNEVIVTEDHSVMIERDGVFMEIKPRDICVKDVLISVSEDK